MADFSIGPAQGTDAEWCAGVMASTDLWIRLGRTYEHCLARLTRPEHEVLVARRNGEPCGFVILHPTGAMGSPYISTIATDAALRGQGIGSALLDAAERSFSGSPNIFLCVTSFNEGARKLYERHGYKVVGELKDYIIPGVSEIIMHKRLRT